MAAPNAPGTISVSELLARVRQLPAPPAPLADRLAAARRRPRLVPWRQIAARTEPAAFVTAAYCAFLGREPLPVELPALTAAAPATRPGRLAYLDALRHAPEAAQLNTYAPGLWFAARLGELLSR